MIYAGAMIYLVLAWIFASYGWPLVVMSVIPFGLVGAVVGHWLSACAVNSAHPAVPL
jgi:multidrug efflux pump subunit AcrB